MFNTSLPPLKLRDFLLNRMRMSDIYQPGMPKALIQGNGRASLDVAAALAPLDQGQLDRDDEI